MKKPKIKTIDWRSRLIDCLTKATRITWGSKKEFMVSDEEDRRSRLNIISKLDDLILILIDDLMKNHE